MRLSFTTFLVLLALSATAARTFAGDYTVERGEIAGAKFIVACPAQWDGHVLLLAHGLRPEDQPLHAEIYETQPPVSKLLDQHWLVALTSYRRNGLILQDAISDLDNLRRHIVQHYGQPGKIYLMGESMGGAIVTAMMETRSSDFAGAVAIGAALQVESMEPGFSLTRQPRGPLLFLTNRTELEEPQAYVAASKESAFAPVLWSIARDGHVNANAAEKLSALEAVVRWTESGTTPLPGFDATLNQAAGPSTIEFAADHSSANGRVTGTHAVYGNLTLDFQPADLTRLGVAPGDSFILEAHGHSYRVLYGQTFGSVPRGDWVGFPDPDGHFTIAINRGNAAATAGLKAGDPVTLRRVAGKK